MYYYAFVIWHLILPHQPTTKVCITETLDYFSIRNLPKYIPNNLPRFPWNISAMVVSQLPISIVFQLFDSQYIHIQRLNIIYVFRSCLYENFHKTTFQCSRIFFTISINAPRDVSTCLSKHCILDHVFVRYPPGP